MTKDDLKDAILLIIRKKTFVDHWGNIDCRGHGSEQSVGGTSDAANEIMKLLEDIARND